MQQLLIAFAIIIIGYLSICFLVGFALLQGEIWKVREKSPFTAKWLITSLAARQVARKLSNNILTTLFLFPCLLFFNRYV